MSDLPTVLLYENIPRILKRGTRLHEHVIVFDDTDERERSFPQR